MRPWDKPCWPTPRSISHVICQNGKYMCMDGHLIDPMRHYDKHVRLQPQAHVRSTKPNKNTNYGEENDF